MNKLFTLLLFIFLSINSLFSQNEFGTIGSYWIYDYVAHDGGGAGWDILSVESDSIINGETYKVLKRTYHHTRFIPPSFLQGEEYHLMQITGDSVYINDNFLLDLDMGLEDSIYISNVQSIVDIQLSIDSITTETIGGYDYKKWHGQKLCPNTDYSPYEEFTFLESVGQIGYYDYLLWNIDGCFIGGGSNLFKCYKNGDFIYPPGQECELLMLTNNEEILANEKIEIFPNPGSDRINITSQHSIINHIKILSLSGKDLINKSVSSQNQMIDISRLATGLYIAEVDIKGNKLFYKFVKTK